MRTLLPTAATISAYSGYFMGKGKATTELMQIYELAKLRTS